MARSALFRQVWDWRSLFWPSLFVWSISLLKESLYFFLGATVLTAAVAVVRRPSWRSRALALVIVAAAAVLERDLRPGALMLMGSGLLVGAGLTVVSASRRVFVIAALCGTVAVGLSLSRLPVEERLVAGLEAAAKTHSGHVFTVGHPYQLLDAGFYVNPQTPISSTLTLTREEAARFVIRAAASFLAVPAPWQLQSARGSPACRSRSRGTRSCCCPSASSRVAATAVTCMLVGYAVRRRRAGAGERQCRDAAAARPGRAVLDLAWRSVSWRRWARSGRRTSACGSS